MNITQNILPKGWRWDTLGNPNISIISAGGTPRRSVPSYYQGSIPWAKIGDLTKAGKYIKETEENINDDAILNSNAKVFPKDTVLVSMYGSIGKAAIGSIPIATNQAIIGIQLNRDILEPEYLYYFLTSIQSQLENLGRGATQNNINAGHIKDINIPIPPLPVQERIVQILQKADEIRRKRQEAVAIADAILPAIFNEMFGDPGKNPKDLPIKRLQEICTSTSGGTPSKQNSDFWTNGTIPWVSAKDMKVPEIINVPDKITEKALGNRSLTKPGTVLIVVRGMILQHSVPICLVKTLLTFNQDIKGLIPRDGIPGEFLFWLLRCSEKRLLEMVDTASHGTKKLDTDRLMGLKVFEPELKAMKHFAAIHRHFFDAQAKRLDAVLETEKTFNALLSRAFTGKLTAEWEAANAKQIASKHQFYQRLPQLVILSFLKKKISHIQRLKAETAVLLTALMKYVFLFQMEGTTKRRLYQFIPYHYGPFAKELYTDLETLQEQGLITVDNSDEDKTRISLLNSETVETELAELPDDLQADIDEIVDSYGDLDLTSLLATVYEKYPAYAKKSKLKRKKSKSNEQET